MLDPIADVVEGISKLDFDEMRFDAQISFGGSVFSGPAPNLVEHATMQAFEKTFASRDLASPEAPLNGRSDIFLFEFVQLAAQRNVRWDKISALGGRYRCRMVVGGM